MDVDGAGEAHGVVMGDLPRAGSLVVEVPMADGTPLVVPTGTVTFLSTDVEGSTTLWEQALATTGSVAARHDAVIDEAVAAHGGVRPVERGQGDSVVAAFTRPSDAVAAALEV